MPPWIFWAIHPRQSAGNTLIEIREQLGYIWCLRVEQKRIGQWYQESRLWRTLVGGGRTALIPMHVLNALRIKTSGGCISRGNRLALQLPSAGHTLDPFKFRPVARAFQATFCAFPASRETAITFDAAVLASRTTYAISTVNYLLPMITKWSYL